MNRRLFSSNLLATTAALAQTSEAKKDLGNRLAAARKAPVLRREKCKAPVMVEAIELVRAGNSYVVKARSKNGAVGYADAHSSVMSVAYPILLKKVAPVYRNKDARDLEQTLTDVYLASSNYKWQGLPFWVSVAVVEMAILDLLGQETGLPLGELVGEVRRRQIPVYRASGNRGNRPEAEMEFLQKVVAETGAGAIKFRLGARMRYDEASTKRDLAMIPLTRKTFGDDFTIYADANGSYDVPMAVRIGRLMEEAKMGFFEEPVPFDHYEETKQIADALQIPIALGEEEMSLRGFQSIIEHGVAQVIQPDLLYFGGMLRSLKVAKMCEVAGLPCTPHMSGGGLGFLYVAHFASVVKDPGAHQEFKGTDDTLPVTSKTSSLKSEKGQLVVPTGPGLGIEIAKEVLAKAEPIKV
ncbi:MAG: mandelate racemase/muconate lactonizing enzyme family protein [Bryobacter sp.]|nr:mandelate racemase/muconate lactonizing enzyme family protein [Bryobacter sp.]